MPPTRLLSLDAFRGMVIVVMFLVNLGGTDPAFSLGLWAPEHAQRWMPHMGWNDGRMGNGLADYVFPWFLFIVGVAIPFSMGSGRGRAQSAWMRIALAFKRGLIIYLLGSLLWAASIGYLPRDVAARWNGPITSSIFLHWDILPLIGFGYFFAVLMQHTPRWARLTFVVLVLAFKFCTLKMFVPEGSGTWVDALASKTSLHHTLGSTLGLSGPFGNWTITLINQGFAFSSVVVLGALSGDILRDDRLGMGRRAAILAGAGGIACVIALAWWLIGDFPFSKDFVSSTYILITAGSAAALLAGCFWLVDIKKWTSLSPLRILGVNALAAYFLAEFLWKTVLMQWQVILPPGFQPQTLAAGAKPESALAITAFKAWLQHWTTPTLGTFLLVGLYILFYWLIALVLYRKQWFIKV